MSIRSFKGTKFACYYAYVVSAYAAIYPIALIAVVLVSQLLIILF